MLGDDRVELKRKPTRRTLSPGCASAASGAASTAPRPVTKARRFSNPIDPPQCEGPVEAVRLTAHVPRLAPFFSSCLLTSELRPTGGEVPRDQCSSTVRRTCDSGNEGS